MEQKGSLRRLDLRRLLKHFTEVHGAEAGTQQELCRLEQKHFTEVHGAEGVTYDGTTYKVREALHRSAWSRRSRL